MNPSLLRSMDLESYRMLLGALLPDGFSFALTDTEGELCWHDDDFPANVPLEQIPALIADRNKSRNRNPQRVQLSSDGAYAYVVTIATDENNPVALLWAAAPNGTAAVEGTEWLSTIAEHISKDLALNIELDVMAVELTERYEELNLVYHTEDQVNYFAEGQAALNQLVRNCCEYLDVGLSALIMHDKGVTISHQSSSQTISDASLLIDHMGGDLYQAIMKNADPIIINDVASAEAFELWRGLAYRLLAMPILDAKGEAKGMIAILNGYAKRPFSNSDKNLLQVMARKAAKIVQVNYDLLTGLVNREGLEFLAEQLLQDARSRGTVHSVLHIDIDQLHIVNDTVSHDAGDALIQAIAAQLHRATRDTDTVSRIGGDELGVLLKQCPLDRGASIADKLRESIVDLVVPWSDRSLATTVSIGVAPIDAETDTAGAALAAAELACDAAKEMGRNRVQQFHHGDTGLMKRHQEMEAVGQIQTALKEDHLRLFGQIIAPLGNDTAGLHLEVLLRMTDGDGNVVSPGEFLPAAERYHLMPEIDRWVIRKVFAYLNEHVEQLTDTLSMISINLSGQTLNEPAFVPALLEAISTLQLPLDRICFEITETVAVNNLEDATRFMHLIKAHGCRFALDDFGSGLSSFGYLRELPIDYLKIDGSLVTEIAVDEVAASMVTAVQHVASVMKLETIAEYVESQAIVDKLREIGVTYAQGYFVSKPQPLADHFQQPAAGAEAVIG